MPHFYLHVRNHHDLAVDPDGVDLPNIDAARAEALRVAQELLADWPSGWPQAQSETAIEITDRAGQTLLRIPFSDVT